MTESSPPGAFVKNAENDVLETSSADVTFAPPGRARSLLTTILRFALVFVVVAAATLLCGTAISNPQYREWPHAAGPQMEGMHRGETQHRGDGNRDHRQHPAIIVVGVPFFGGPAYGSYDLAPSVDAYRTIDGFYYYSSSWSSIGRARRRSVPRFRSRWY